MKLLKLLCVVCICQLSGSPLIAQVVFGSKGFTIKAATTISMDSLVITPAVDYTISANSLNLAHMASNATGLNSIRKTYSFSTPLTSFTGYVGMRYDSLDLNGNFAPWLRIAYTGNDTTWKINRGCNSASDFVDMNGPGIAGDTLFSITAVTAPSFYSKSSGDITLLNTWGVNTDGTGTNPPDFNGITSYYILSNRSGTVNLGQNWSVGGLLKVSNGIDFQIGGNTLVANNINCAGTIGGNGSSGIELKGQAGTLNLTAGANAFKTVVLDSNASVVLGDTLKMVAGTTPGVVSVGWGAILNAAGFLTLLSDTNSSARVGIVNGAIQGNVNIMQYVPGGRRAYRFWAHPFSSYIPLTQIENYIDVTGAGGATNGFTTTGSNASSCFWYHTVSGNSTMGSDPGWKAFTSCYPTVDSNRFQPYEGIRLFIRGTKGQGLSYTTDVPSPVVVGMYGPVNQGNIDMPLAKGVDTTKDYNLIGNPYPSQTDIGTVIANARTAGKVRGSAFYVWNPYHATSGAFEPKVIGSPYIIEANTSFEVRAAYNGATLNFTESNKATSIPEVLLKNEPGYIVLRVYDSSYHPWDVAYINFTDAATDAEDEMYDAGKVNNPDLNFCSISSDNQKLCIDARPFKNDNIIPLGFQSNYALEYVIRTEGYAIPAGGKLYLHDKYLGKYSLVENGSEYRFKVTRDSLSQGDNRFELKMSTISVDTTQNEVPLKIAIAPNPASEEVTISINTPGNQRSALRIMDINGACFINKDLGNEKYSAMKIDVSTLPAGIYAVELTYGNAKLVEKLLKE